MSSEDSSSKVLGVAFLLQAITSLLSGLILRVALIVPGNISESMIRIAGHAWLMRANILGEVTTAAGIIFLAAVLFLTLREHNQIMALVALGLYILEAALLAASRIAAFSLLRVSEEYVAGGRPANLLRLANQSLEFMDSGYALLMLPFCFGAILFYYLFYKSRVIPRVLSLWGLIAVSLALIGSLLVACGREVSFLIFLPYLPFEFVVGIWILIKGLRKGGESAGNLS